MFVTSVASPGVWCTGSSHSLDSELSVGHGTSSHPQVTAASGIQDVRTWRHQSLPEEGGGIWAQAGMLQSPGAWNSGMRSLGRVGGRGTVTLGALGAAPWELVGLCLDSWSTGWSSHWAPRGVEHGEVAGVGGEGCLAGISRGCCEHVQWTAFEATSLHAVVSSLGKQSATQAGEGTAWAPDSVGGAKGQGCCMCCPGRHASVSVRGCGREDHADWCGTRPPGQLEGGASSSWFPQL